MYSGWASGARAIPSHTPPHRLPEPVLSGRYEADEQGNATRPTLDERNESVAIVTILTQDSGAVRSGWEAQPKAQRPGSMPGSSAVRPLGELRGWR